MVSLRERTNHPIVTGTSVLGIKYAEGVMLAADTILSYGNMAKFKDSQRIVCVNPCTVLGGSGEYSDFQAITDLLKRNALENKCTADSLYEEDGPEECSREVYNYLRAIMYDRRNKMNPVWNDFVVAGFAQDKHGEKPFLGLVDKIGTTYEDTYIATGLGVHLALPIMRKKYRQNMTEREAHDLLEDCMKVLFYRDSRASNRIQIAKVTINSGVFISEPYVLETRWESDGFVVPKGELDADGGW